MYVRVRELLTEEERKRYMQIPSDISEWTLRVLVQRLHLFERGI
ncbi:hypothetical protein U2I54_28980 [Bacillus pseudomycoides]|uniref:Uncharacterized protein n=1 Tax=Bacillus bingmayongensis TaxID=1150157 RepID=A0ABU5K546_9BACI|nr:hypothetical protein [Bacillus pseudomycoides]